MPLVIRILIFLARNWRFIAITIGLMAGAQFVLSEAWSQMIATLERFIWLIILCLFLVVVARFFTWRTANANRRDTNESK